MSRPTARRATGKNRPSPEPLDKPGLETRRVATKLLAAVVDAHASLDGLTDPANGQPGFRALDARDRSLVRAILMTALRHRSTIEALLARRLERPLPANARTLSHALHVAAAQILFLDVPDSAAVDLAVTQAKSDPRLARFAGLVNGVLRNLIRVKARALPAALAQTREAPDWFAERLEAAYGAEKTAAILAMHRLEPPVDFTVRDDPQHWADALGGIVLPTGSVRIAKLEAGVDTLPGFEEGAWWVQDAAASLPAKLLGDIAGARVADLCAAPGGKTAQLVHAGADITAVDLSKSRLKRLAENLKRLRLEAQIVESDIRKFEPETPFDAILIDAPCSSTGTVRRHPDVPWTKTPEDIGKLAALQRALLDHAVTLVKPGGRVVFSNCSLDPAEGETMLEAFLAETPDVALDPIQPDELAGIAPFVTPEGYLRTTPADSFGEAALTQGLDGFFAARLVRGR
ncbi:transcription antitermination factor NusB [Nitratireductor sp. GISD-1A_MAKvit]|uniref:RsmB/NOP family class I SAM-dependent RNA methyltransferase n=1 Tax=Nitratireductor sp. GISD-1A_MAKvit TaxID=3234198 RepID=UPI00346743E7